MVMIRAEFEKVKGEIDGQLHVFAGDMGRVIKKTSESGSKDRLKMLRYTAMAVALIPADDLWKWGEDSVRMLDARGEEVPTGGLKQAYTRLSSILSRCTRLVRLHKEVVAGTRVPKL